MCRSEPQTPVASTRTTASSRSISSGSGRSSTCTSPGAWKVTACITGQAIASARVTDAFYVIDGDTATPSALTRGPWDPNAQHAGPPSALLARAIELCEPREGARVARVTVEILAPVPIAPLTLSASVVRPGRSVELLEASLSGPGGDVVRARAWRLATAGITADWEQDAPPSGPEDATAVEFFATGDRVGWHTAMEIVFAGGKFLEPGPATVWMRPRVEIGRASCRERV